MKWVNFASTSQYQVTGYHDKIPSGDNPFLIIGVLYGYVTCSMDIPQRRNLPELLTFICYAPERMSWQLVGSKFVNEIRSIITRVPLPSSSPNCEMISCVWLAIEWKLKRVFIRGAIAHACHKLCRGVASARQTELYPTENCDIIIYPCPNLRINIVNQATLCEAKW